MRGKNNIQEYYLYNILVLTGQLMLNASSLNNATFNHSCEEEHEPFKDEAQTALFEDTVRTAQ